MDMKDRVMVLFVRGAAVTLLGEENDRTEPALY
jgi:hypothetical protein